jgi:phage-related protein
MADGYEIAEGHLEITADPSEAMRNVQAFLRRVDQRLHQSEDEAERSGRRSGRRYGDGLNEGLRGAVGGNLINDLLLPGGGGGGAGGGGGGGGFIQGLLSSLSGGFRRILDEIRTLVSDIESMLSGLGGGGGGGGFLSDMRDTFNDMITWVRRGLTSVIHYLHSAWIRTLGALRSSSVATFFSDMLRWIRLTWTRFSTWASGAFSRLWTRVTTWFGGMGSGLRVFWSRFSLWAIATFRTLGTLGRVFWARFRGWASTAFTTLALVAGILFSRMRSWASSLFTRMRGWFSRVWSAASTRARSLWTRIAGWARSAFTAISGWFSSLFTSLSSGASAVWTHLSSAFSSLSSAASAAGPLLQATFYLSLIPLVLGLGGAVLDLAAALLALPAAIGVLIAILAPLIVGFKGFAAAVSAGLSGDVDKFNEALKKLAPSARAVAKEFVKLGPALKKIKSATQQALFAPLVGTVAPLAKTLLPALATGMAKVAGALGRMLAGFAKLLGTPDVIRTISAVFATTERIMNRLGPALTNLFGALFGTMEGGLPFVERFFGVMADGIQNAADWLNKIKGDGSLTRWLEQAWSIGKDLWALLVAVGRLIGSLFANTGDEGQGWIQGLTKMTEKLAAFFESAKGQEAINTLVSFLKKSGTTMMWLANIIIFLVERFNGMVRFIKAVPGFFKNLWQSIKDGAKAVGDWFAMIGRVSWDWIKDAGKAIGDFFVGVGKWFVDAYNTVVGWGAAILEWFGKVPGWIGEFFSNVPGWIADGLAALRDAIFYSIGWIVGSIVRIILSIPGWLASAWQWIKKTTSDGAAALWAEVSSWPGRAGDALSSFGSTVASVFDTAWDAVFESTSRFIQDNVEALRAMPGKAWDALSALPGKVGGVISGAWAKGREATSAGVASVVDTAKGLPDKIWDALSGAGTWLYNTGRNMIMGLVNGIGDVLHWAVDQAKAAAHAIAKGFMDAVEVKSPSQLMRREAGRQLLPGVMQGVDDTLPDARRHLGAVANMMVGGFQPTVNVAAPNVHTGDVMLQADFGDGIKRVVPLIITRNPRVVAGAAAVGRRERNGWVNTSRGAN